MTTKSARSRSASRWSCCADPSTRRSQPREGTTVRVLTRLKAESWADERPPGSDSAAAAAAVVHSEGEPSRGHACTGSRKLDRPRHQSMTYAYPEKRTPVRAGSAPSLRQSWRGDESHRRSSLSSEGGSSSNAPAPRAQPKAHQTDTCRDRAGKRARSRRACAPRQSRTRRGCTTSHWPPCSTKVESRGERRAEIGS